MTSLTSAPSAARRYVRVLSIAGSDSGGGAGIQADLKTFSALGCYGMTAITAITAQNTCGVTGIHGIPPEMLKAQIDAVVQDIGVDAVKIGMLHSPEVVRVVADAIRKYQLPNVVLDPVMVATSGDRLIAAETVSVLVQELFDRFLPADQGLAHLVGGQLRDPSGAVRDPVQHRVVEEEHHPVRGGVYICFEVAVAQVDSSPEGRHRVLQAVQGKTTVRHGDRLAVLLRGEEGQRHGRFTAG